MISQFTPASDFVPEGLDATDWSSLAPLYQELLDRAVDDADALERLLFDRSELDAAVGEAGSNLYITMTCHTDDEAAAGAYRDFIENVQPHLTEVAFQLDQKLTSVPASSSLDEARYRVLLRNARATVELFREENIPLDTQLATLAQDYAQICGAMTIDFDGREQTVPQMQRYQEETDRSVREAAWRAVADRRARDRDALDEIFDKMITLRHEVASNVGLKSYADYAFHAYHRFDYTPDDCHAFARGVEETIVPAARRLYETRRELLGLDSLRPWDNDVDVHGRGALRPFESPEELVSKTSSLFHRMDPSLGEAFDSLGDGDCLDLDSRPGKAPGGYQATRQRVRRPFIFMNAAGLQRDVETLLHEAGHAFHALASRVDPLVQYRSDVPMEFAEVASMSMELTAHPFLDTFYDDTDSQRARRVHLEQMADLFISVALIDQFQHWLYANPTHTRDDRAAKWFELQERFSVGVDWTGLEDLRRTHWQRILHLFEVPFYYIEYGIAQLGAIQLWSRYRENPGEAIDGYKRALSLGGSQPLPTLYETAGLQFEFGPEMISRLWTGVEAELEALPA